MKKIAKWVRHNQGVFTFLLVCAVLLTWGVGCDSKVTSLLEPAKMVSRVELAKIETDVSWLKDRYVDDKDG